MQTYIIITITAIILIVGIYCIYKSNKRIKHNKSQWSNRNFDSLNDSDYHY